MHDTDEKRVREMRIRIRLLIESFLGPNWQIVFKNRRRTIHKTDRVDF